MGGWGEFLGKIANHFQNREERRRNEIEKLESRQRFILTNKRNDLVDEYDLNDIRLKQLYAQAKNS